MSRLIQTRWRINGTLVAQTPIHIGGVGGDADTDLALAVNGRGEYYVPGTSLAGALRNWMGRSLKDDEQLKDIWGDHQSDQRGASWISIEDAPVALSGKTIEIREGVGIDRYTGTAAEKCKYNRAILPKGSTFPLNITFDLQTDSSPSSLWQLLQALEQGDIRIGAAKTRGLGRVKLAQINIYEQKIGNANGMFQTLLQGGEAQNWETLKANHPYHPPARMTFDLAWIPRDPVMVKAEGDGIAVDMFPLVSQVDTGVKFVIPGSSIKGVLRAHAERILRTVCNWEVGNDFLQQVQLDLVNELFGSASKSEQEGLIGVLAVDDCYATMSIAAEHWSRVENSTKEAIQQTTDLQSALKDALENDHPFRTLQPAYHVAIDRWTGGSAEGMLYSVLEPIGVEWEPIELHLDLARLQHYSADKLPCVLTLLFLVLRDFAHRKIPIGYGTNRGMGTVEVQAMTMSSSRLPELTGLENEVDHHNIGLDLTNLNPNFRQHLTDAWTNWIAQSEVTP